MSVCDKVKCIKIDFRGKAWYNSVVQKSKQDKYLILWNLQVKTYIMFIICMM